jgi:hypothetical protein
MTVTPVSTPNQTIWESDFMGYKCRVYDITFDSAYLTTGEVITAASLGWNTIQGALILEHAQNRASSGTLSVGLIIRPNAARTQVTVQAYETAATVDTSHKEVTSAADLSTYTARVAFIGT